MAELRKNIITRDWVVIAKERASRHFDYKYKSSSSEIKGKYSPDCPFCPGNERQTTKESLEIKDEKESWLVRVVPNKYPALSCQFKDQLYDQDNYFQKKTAYGMHEVIIETPRHDLSLALLKKDQLIHILYTYLHRYQEFQVKKNIEMIVIFKNHGRFAGTSVEHPHSQIVALPFVPQQLESRAKDASSYFKKNNKCMYCDTVFQEKNAKERVIVEGEHFIAFIPFAALSPFHIWIFPKRHCSSYDQISKEEINELSEIIRQVLLKLHLGLKDPDYNMIVRSAPLNNDNNSYLHWYISIIARVSNTAGFELGTGTFINASSPEDNAKFLRDIQIPK